MAPPPPSPRAQGYRPRPEWSPHDSCITAWPCHRYAWGDALEGAQREVAAFLHQVASGPGAEHVELLCASEEAERQARAALAALGARVRYLRVPYGDIWLRDLGPLFLRRDGDGGGGAARGEAGEGEGSASAHAPELALCFAFNGWGEKYVYPHDAEVARAVAGALGLPGIVHPAIIEGGAIELDGEGTCLTTESCLLNDNRNGPGARQQLERALSETLAVDKVLWLGEGLAGDHTDGHIDNLARFIAPATVMHALPDSDDDPNRDVLQRIARELSSMTDARGRALSLHAVPSAGRVLDAGGQPMAASYLNFYIGNASVIVPAFGDAARDERARAAIAERFPRRRVVSSSARAILEGGGTLHCITRQRPAPATTQADASPEERSDDLAGRGDPGTRAPDHHDRRAIAGDATQDGREATQ